MRVLMLPLAARVHRSLPCSFAMRGPAHVARAVRSKEARLCRQGDTRAVSVASLVVDAIAAAAHPIAFFFNVTQRSFESRSTTSTRRAPRTPIRRISHRVSQMPPSSERRVERALRLDAPLPRSSPARDASGEGRPNASPGPSWSSSRRSAVELTRRAMG